MSKKRAIALLSSNKICKRYNNSFECSTLASLLKEAFDKELKDTDEILITCNSQVNVWKESATYGELKKVYKENFNKVFPSENNFGIINISQNNLEYTGGVLGMGDWSWHDSKDDSYNKESYIRTNDAIYTLGQGNNGITNYRNL